MRFAFGNGCSVVDFAEYAPAPDPKPDPRAAAEMAVFDKLPPAVRQVVANSAFGAQVADMMSTISRGGATPGERDRLKARGLMPCDVGTEGVMLERMAMAEEVERMRIARELD